MRNLRPKVLTVPKLNQTLTLALGALLLFGCAGETVGDGDNGQIKLGDTGGNIEDTGLGNNDGGATATDSTTGEGDAGNTDLGNTDPSDGANDDTTATPNDAATDTTGPVDCPGQTGCACSSNDQCDSGACLETPDGKTCAKPCVDSCPNGYSCKAFGGSDAFFVCYPKWTTLCSPCEKHADCKVDGSDARCLDYGANGKFCGSTCESDTDCPTGYGCQDDFDKDAGTTFKQCRLSDEKAECSCNAWATKAGYSTECSKSNDIGTCKAQRKCTVDGLTACAALEPAADLCNGADDDCDGTVDNLPQEVTCAVTATLADGTVASCSGTPTCKDGKQLCEGAQTPEAESCDEKDNDCDGNTDEDFAWTNPVTAAKAGIGEFCGVGPCVGGKVVCKSATEALCDTEKAVKAEGCDGIDNDCNGLTDDGTCDDGDECTADTCSATDTKCVNEPSADCDDKNACTADSCDKATGKCVNTAQEGSCDDGNPCTTSDVCKLDGDTAKCEPGADTKDCDDTNPCTDDSCDAEKGCVNLANAATEACYSGPDGTDGSGTCMGGVKACKDGKLDAKCDGEVVPNALEACDGKDDDCNGKTDEGCKIDNATAHFGSGFGRVQGATAAHKTAAWYLIGGWVNGRAPAKDEKNKTAEVGFLYRLLSQWK